MQCRAMMRVFACFAASTTWRGRTPTSSEAAAAACPELVSVHVFFRAQGVLQVPTWNALQF